MYTLHFVRRCDTDVLRFGAGGTLIDLLREPGADMGNLRQGDGAYPRRQYAGSGGEGEILLC